jgi:hypothetical protein
MDKLSIQFKEDISGTLPDPCILSNLHKVLKKFYMFQGFEYPEKPEEAGTQIHRVPHGEALTFDLATPNAGLFYFSECTDHPKMVRNFSTLGKFAAGPAKRTKHLFTLDL